MLLLMDARKIMGFLALLALAGCASAPERTTLVNDSGGTRTCVNRALDFGYQSCIDRAHQEGYK
jgi:hypothetical protein